MPKGEGGNIDMEGNHELMRRLKDWELREGTAPFFIRSAKSKATQGSSLQGVYGHPVVVWGWQLPCLTVGGRKRTEMRF